MNIYMLDSTNFCLTILILFFDLLFSF